jgi:hypothetical protein
MHPDDCEDCGATGLDPCHPDCSNSAGPDNTELAQDWADLGSL